MTVDLDDLLQQLRKMIPGALGLKITAEVTVPGVSVMGDGPTKISAVVMAYLTASFSMYCYDNLDDLKGEISFEEWREVVDELTGMAAKRIGDLNQENN